MTGSLPTASTSRAQPEDGPLRMLSRLHARTLAQCAELCALAAHVAACGCDEQARRASQAALHYFDTCPPQYRADEEKDLFPALLESMAGSDAVCLRDLTWEMTRQHRAADAMWQRLREPLAALAGGQSATLEGAAVQAFAALHRSQIEREETELLPMAARLLTDDALEQLWASMRERHGEPIQGPSPRRV